MLLFTLHTISRGEKRTPSVVLPGNVFDATEREAADLLMLNAVRAPTDMELRLYELANATSARAEAAFVTPRFEPVVDTVSEGTVIGEAPKVALHSESSANITDGKVVTSPDKLTGGAPKAARGKKPAATVADDDL